MFGDDSIHAAVFGWAQYAIVRWVVRWAESRTDEIRSACRQCSASCVTGYQMSLVAPTSLMLCNLMACEQFNQHSQTGRPKFQSCWSVPQGEHALLVQCSSRIGTYTQAPERHQPQQLTATFIDHTRMTLAVLPILHVPACAVHVSMLCAAAALPLYSRGL